MGRPRKGEHVLGPYRSGDRWQVIVVGASGERAHSYRATEGEALELAAELREQVERAATTIDEALDEYERYLTVEKQNKPRSIKETLRRLRVLVPVADRDRQLAHLTTAHGKRWYRALVDARDDAGEPTYSVDTHRNYLAEARTFFGWCVERRWARENPLAGVKGVGRRRHGKPQLRIDEARRWMKRASELAADEPGAVAAMLTLLLGLRAGEVVSRLVRDVDDEGRLFWVPDSKTEAGRRKVEVPELGGLREHLRELARGRPGEERLFKGRGGPGRGRAPHRDRKWVTTWVAQIAEDAGVPRVTAHGMRGLHSTLAIDAGMSGHLVAASLGHESFTTTTTSYAAPASTEAAARRRTLKVLAGGGEVSSSLSRQDGGSEEEM